MKVAVTGPRGRLGSELVRQGCLPVQASVTEFAELGNEIRNLNPDVVIHCAAMTDVDGCELAPMKAGYVNTGGTYILSQVFTKPIVYISTDYIFDGYNGPYREMSAPSPISIYGWSKLGGEIVLKNRRNPHDLIIRTTVLFDVHSQNFVTAVVNKLRAGEPVTLPDGLYGSPTYIPHLARGILAAIRQGVNDKNLILNLAGDRVMTRYQLGHLIATMMDCDPDLITPGPVTGQAPRPPQAGLDVSKAKSLGLPVFSPVDGIQEVLDALETVDAGRPGNN